MIVEYNMIAVTKYKNFYMLELLLFKKKKKKNNFLYYYLFITFQLFYFLSIKDLLSVKYFEYFEY